MDQSLFYPIGRSDSCRYACTLLEQAGFALTDHPSPEITHLLLDVPSFDINGRLPDCTNFRELLRMLPSTVTVIGGNLDSLTERKTVDLLKDPRYLAKNAAITAECALQAVAPYLTATFADSPALILGWGRIGKCLAKLLRCMGCSVTVAARKETDRAMLEALGFKAVDFSSVSGESGSCRILFNTVPDLSVHRDIPELLKNCVAVDLASHPGMQGRNVITARGLPGKYAPESSGKLIAETILRRYKEGSL